VQLVKMEIKDIESLPAFFTRLVSLSHNSDLKQRLEDVPKYKAKKYLRPKP